MPLGLWVSADIFFQGYQLCRNPSRYLGPRRRTRPPRNSRKRFDHRGRSGHCFLWRDQVQPHWVSLYVLFPPQSFEEF
jgi:hypothetical protein